jgi:hypothetical protein
MASSLPGFIVLGLGDCDVYQRERAIVRGRELAGGN